MPSLLANTIGNLKGQGLEVEEVLADAGYSNGEALRALEEHNLKGYIPNVGQYKPSREGFTYYNIGDYYQCSQGKHVSSPILRSFRSWQVPIEVQMLVYFSQPCFCQ